MKISLKKIEDLLNYKLNLVEEDTEFVAAPVKGKGSIKSLLPETLTNEEQQQIKSILVGSADRQLIEQMQTIKHLLPNG